jgi:two-component system cell cycle response regulator DivK
MSHAIIVEDDAHNAVLFRKLIEKRCGWRVTVTEDVAEVLALAREADTVAIVMDVSLTNSRWEGRAVNGVDVTRLLKADPRTAGVPILLATAHAMRGDAEALLRDSGADDYVAKPVLDHAAFVEQLRALAREAA